MSLYRIVRCTYVVRSSAAISYGDKKSLVSETELVNSRDRSWNFCPSVDFW